MDGTTNNNSSEDRSRCTSDDVPVATSSSLL